MDFANYTRRKTSTTHVGALCIGSDYPIRIQTMANTSTNDIEGSVAQALRCREAGAELLRFTTQGLREVESLRQIREQLLPTVGDSLPLVADVHFQADVADAAARVVEKVRVNPGNYIDPARKFKHIDYTDEEYQAELKRLRERFTALLTICKEHKTAIRLGVNHGSLSDRIMSRYGDTPAGMAESVMEFLRVAVDEQYTDIVISIKASNTRVMVDTMRLLVRQMDNEHMAFPLHLGVTEAGEGEDGRIKSAVGIGALLAEGIGDTIRVSLSEAPEAEIPVARAIRDYFADPESIRYHGANVEMTKCENEKIVHYASDVAEWGLFALHAAAECGRLLWAEDAKALVLSNPHFTDEELERLSKDILQAAGVMRYKTEFVSCPGCGRTLFGLEDTIAAVKSAFREAEKEHPFLRTLKIGVMGCIVNGPGEMADADYGYVGAARGKVSLYEGKTCIKMNIPQEEAVSVLIDYIVQKCKIKMQN
ncbi:MAG: (E)-4-hydroxy-3-methylbut-2-enyl-diphosphate synthase [Paludibacteraceae bacterium]|nr:(E)-4-hydroxy-3-methylbut-2-enyl-diphosphate synthase [Paludibacteraceae bacterium]